MGANGPTEQFGRLPYRIVAARAVSGLDRSELAVYLVVAAHVNGASWTAHPSIRRVAELAGMHDRTATRVIARLRDKGLIDVETGGGRGRTSMYTLNTNPDSMGGTVSEGGIPGTHADTVSGENSGNPSPKPRQSEPKTPAKSAETPAPHAGGTEGQKGQSNRAAAVAAKGSDQAPTEPDPAVIEALTAAEIAEPTRTALATLPGITAELVARVDRETRRRGGGCGAVVNGIRAAVAADAARTANRQGHADSVDRAMAARHAENEATTRQIAEVAAANAELIDGLSDAELAAQRDATIAAAPAFLAEQWADADPRDGDDPAARILRAAICKRVRTNGATTR